MSRLKYADYYDEQMDVRGWSVAHVHGEILRKCPGYAQVFTLAACAEFCRGRHTPNSAMASAWEQVFGVNLPPRYYAWPDGRKP